MQRALVRMHFASKNVTPKTTVAAHIVSAQLLMIHSWMSTVCALTGNEGDYAAGATKWEVLAVTGCLTPWMCLRPASGKLMDLNYGTIGNPCVDVTGTGCHV